jgi:hypothetical protein
VHDALLVRVLERLRDIAKDADGLRPRHGAGTHEADTKRLAFDEGHRVVREPAGVAGGQNRNDVRVLEASRELNFPPESLGADTGSQLRRQNLDDHPAPQRTLLGHEHSAHAATTELTLDRVRVAESRLQLVL